MSSSKTKILFLVTLLALSLTILAGCATIPTVTPQEVYQRLPDLDTGLILLDVRTPEEWTDDGHIEGATLIPLDELEYRALNELPTDAEIIVYCRSGNRSVEAANYLINAGFTNVQDMQGGINAWKTAGLPFVTGP